MRSSYRSQEEVCTLGTLRGDFWRSQEEVCTLGTLRGDYWRSQEAAMVYTCKSHEMAVVFTVFADPML
jgi:hypothetical protein